MTRIAALLIVTVLAALCACCTAETTDNGIRSKKVADQRLAAYTPLRRVTYRDACGSTGALTFCVDRITITDQAALVEARFRNASPHPFVQEITSQAAVLLADEAGRTLAWNQGEAMEYRGLEERVVHFRMTGSLSGEPAFFTVNNIKSKDPEPPTREFAVVVRLGK